MIRGLWMIWIANPHFTVACYREQSQFRIQGEVVESVEELLTIIVERSQQWIISIIFKAAATIVNFKNAHVVRGPTHHDLDWSDIIVRDFEPRRPHVVYAKRFGCMSPTEFDSNAVAVPAPSYGAVFQLDVVFGRLKQVVSDFVSELDYGQAVKAPRG